MYCSNTLTGSCQSRLPRCPQQQGFSLPELVVVLVVMAILGALSIDGWQDQRAERDLGAAQDSATQFLRMARTQADSQGTLITVSANSLSSPQQLTISGANGWSSAPLLLPTGVAISSSVSNILFRPMGSSSAATLTLSAIGHGAAKTRQVSVSSYGRITQ